MSYMHICISNLSGANPDGPYIHLTNKHVSVNTDAPHYISLKTFLVSKVEFEDEPLHSDSLKPPPQSPTTPSTPVAPGTRPSRLTRFLNDLTLRPNDPPHDLNDNSFGNTSGQGLATAGMSSAPSFPSLANMSTTITSSQMGQTMRNPESDSFAYIETLLESLAVLGKLGSALDIVAQRLPGEIFNLVETTFDEVGERAEYGRRGSTIITGGTTSRSDGAYTFSTGETGHGVGTSNIGPAVASQGGILGASSLRLAALESSAKQVDHETLKDFFWTLYSKLDAISQGLRVVYEISNRIGTVSHDKCLYIHLIPGLTS
jgi:exocyst complex component 4